ncbi:MAG: ECF transporter S component [Bacillota bacterium]
MNTKKYVYSALFIALGILLPMIFHVIGGPSMGRVLLPMHLPVLIGGAFVGPLFGLIIGLITPILSSLFTGMPPVLPMLPIMVAELAVYGLVMGYFFNRIKMNAYLSLVITMLAGRIMASIIVMGLVYGFGFGQLPGNPILYIYGTITAGMPGIIGQLIIVPIVINYLKKYNRAKVSTETVF